MNKRESIESILGWLVIIIVFYGLYSLIAHINPEWDTYDIILSMFIIPLIIVIVGMGIFSCLFLSGVITYTVKESLENHFGKRWWIWVILLTLFISLFILFMHSGSEGSDIPGLPFY